MLELWQTEWCPSSRRVRQRLTELGVDYITHQVPVEKQDRTTLLRATGSDSIPALAFEDGTIILGEDEILGRLDELIVEPAEADAHRQKAARARRRYLEEECRCLHPATR
jgi:glutathione S-transferase